MRNLFSTLAKEYVVPGNMHDRPMVFSMLDPESNKRTNVWTRYQEWETMCQWMASLAWSMALRFFMLP